MTNMSFECGYGLIIYILQLNIQLELLRGHTEFGINLKRMTIPGQRESTRHIYLGLGSFGISGNWIQHICDPSLR